MNTKLITILTLSALPLVGAAMPTRAELDKVSPVVMDLMRPDQEALKAGKKTKSEVAAAALDLVAKADGEAAKLILTKGAYNLYVRDGDFEKAIETLKSFREIVPDMEPQYLANIIESSLRTISRKNGGQLYQLLAETRTLARYRDELKKLKARAKKNADDKTLQLKLAEHYAVLGDWDKALDAFAKSYDRKAAEAAKAEKENAKVLKLAADYWWNYSVHKTPEFEKPFRQHAARLYEKAIASGELVGLNKVQADRRIEEANAFGETVYEAPVTKDGLYCVIDLSGGPNAKRYPVSYLNAIPKGGWTDEYKTTKLVLRRIEPGSFEYMPGKRFMLTKPYYIGVFEVTQKQYELVCGNNPSQYKGDMRPVDTVSYYDIRRSSVGTGWPHNSEVVADTFVGRVRMRSGLQVDLPTEIQWENACRAGGREMSFATADLCLIAKCQDNGGQEDHHVMVGSFKSNGLGLHDMYGNVWEWCLDHDMIRGAKEYYWDFRKKETELDPRGEDGNGRVLRGGSYGNVCSQFQASICIVRDAKYARPNMGFRLAIQPPFVPPKAAAGAAQSRGITRGGARESGQGSRESGQGASESGQGAGESGAQTKAK